METITKCPVCKSTDYSQYLKCKDHTVSAELFSISKCSDCGFLFTNPRPGEEEIAAYYQSEDYVSHSNTNQGLINSIYQLVRKFTLGQKYKLINKLGKEKSILDYGCGTGEFLNYCQSKGWKVSGFEPAENAAQYARENYGISIQNEQELAALPDGSFDVITLWHVLEHIHRLDECIILLKRLLTADGCLVIAVPNHASWDAQVYKENWAAYDLPRHLYHFHPEIINRLFNNHEMGMIHCSPMPFDAFYVSMLSEKYKKGNLANAFLTGLVSNLRAIGEYTWSSQIYLFKKKT